MESDLTGFEEIKKSVQMATTRIEGDYHIKKLTEEQKKVLAKSNQAVESVTNLVLGNHLTKTQVQILKQSNKMMFALGSKKGNLLVAHTEHSYQIFEDSQQIHLEDEQSDWDGNNYCDLVHHGKYYFLVSGITNDGGGLLYLLTEGKVHPKIALIRHGYDSPFFGKSLYPNPFNPKMIIFCDPCYAWLQCFIIGPDEAVNKVIQAKVQALENDSSGGEDSDSYSSKLDPLLESWQIENHKEVDVALDWVTSFNYSIRPSDSLTRIYFPDFDGIILGNSIDESMGHVITSACFLAGNRFLVLIAKSNEILELRIDGENRKFVVEGRKNFTKAFKENEQSTAMAVCPRGKYIVISTRSALNEYRGDYETNLFLYLFRYSKKTGLNFYARFTLKRPKDVASIHDLIFHGYNKSRLIVTANQYNIEDRGAFGEISKGVVSTFMIDFRSKRLSFKRNVYLMGEDEQIGSWYRDGSEVISLDNKGSFVRIKL